MSDNAGRSSSAGATSLRLGQWLALAYFGYWLALAVDRVLAPLLACVTHSAEILDVSVSALSIFVGASYQASPAPMTLWTSLPIFASAAFLLVLWWSGRRGAHPPARGTLKDHLLRSVLAPWTGLWMVLQLAYQVGLFAWTGRGLLGQLLGTQAHAQRALHSRERVAFVASVVLVAAGAMCARRLLRRWPVAIFDDAESVGKLRSLLGASLGLAVPVLIFLLVPLATSWQQGFGPRIALRLTVQAGTFLLILLAAVFVPSRETETALLAERGNSPFSAPGSMVSIAAALLLCFSLSNADAARRWFSENAMRGYSSPHYVLRFNSGAWQPSLPMGFEQNFADARERLLSQQAARLNVSLQNVRLRMLLYADVEALRAATRDLRPYAVEGATIRALLRKPDANVDPAADAQALLFSAWGKPGSPDRARWVARWLSGTWRNQPLSAWRAQIESELGRRTLAELFDNGDESQISPLEREPLLGEWVTLVAGRHGLDGVRGIYSSAAPATSDHLAKALGTTAAQLEREWAGTSPAAEAARVPPSDSLRLLPADFYFRGISFSHEGWRNGRGGYASKQAQGQLEKIRALGANAVALVPYGFVANPSDPQVRYATTDESDLDLAQAADEAHQLGMKVMLKPQLWVMFGTFTGELRIDDAPARARWMKSYREFILHYARLAQLEGFDLLCIGTELEGMTEHAEDWRKLIGDIRRVYRGPLTYAAHFGQEFETLRFWDALDSIGLNNYYPLADVPGSRAEQLAARAQALAAKLEAVSARWHKPILFTEAGYPSVRGGVAQPWIEGDGRAVSLEEQAAGYEAIFRAFAGRPWFRGMFWWKWPSNGQEGGLRDAGFSLAGKPAEEVVRHWFRQMENNPPPVDSAVGHR